MTETAMLIEALKQRLNDGEYAKYEREFDDLDFRINVEHQEKHRSEYES